MPQQRPRQILEAALVVFGEEGFEHARLEDVAEHAQVSKGTIYNYFPSKEALFEEMVRQTLGDLLDIAETYSEKPTAEESFRAFMTAVWYYVRSPQFETIYRLVMAELNRFPHLAAFYQQGVRDRIMDVSSAIIARGIETGEFREMDVNSASRMLLSILVKHGMWCSRRETWPDLAQRSDDQILEEIIDFYLHGIRPDGGGGADQTQRRR
jgi:AcrR family transcriptional regulator